MQNEINKVIEGLIDNNEFEKVRILISENSINYIDEKRYLSIISFFEGKYDKALLEINNGLNYDSENLQLINIKGIILEAMGRKEASNFYYKKSEVLDKKEKPRVLIASPIRQDYKILIEFLDSLRNLNYLDINEEYAFIDDNIDKSCSEVLESFIPQKTKIIKVNSNDQYLKDENTHYWSSNLIDKVAKFKNILIDYAIENEFDYIFFIDSDLVLHKETLNKLLSNNVDIVSNIFWTKWQLDSRLEPQVWLEDNYSFIKDNKVNNTIEMALLETEFINKMKRKGTYEVGGLGACTLISKNALLKGVNFNSIDNISLKGEDRHFCVRAKALGLNLYVDTTYPALHIYRINDLKEVKKYKENNNIYKFKKVILLIHKDFSGSNTYALYKNIPDSIKENYDVKIIRQTLDLNYTRSIMEADILILTEANIYIPKSIYNSNQIIIDLWHGFPIKSMGYEDKNEQNIKAIKGRFDCINYIMSYSEFFNESMNRCINVEEYKYVTTGSPRNDLLNKIKGRENIENILNLNSKDKEIIFYMPTFRMRVKDKLSDGSNLFMESELINCKNLSDFDKWLGENKLIFVIKLHPHEEEFIYEFVKQTENIKLILSKDLEDKKMDLYEILGCADFLITDYSSVYIDMLLLDTFLIFTDNDLDEYSKNRGLLFEYDKVTPGPKVKNLENLKYELTKYKSDKMYYSKERCVMKSKFHKYIDEKSSYRVWQFIETML